MNVRTKAMIVAGAATTAVPYPVGTMPASAAPARHEARTTARAALGGPTTDSCIIGLLAGASTSPDVNWGTCIVACLTGI